MHINHNNEDDFEEMYEGVKEHLFSENFFERLHIEYEGRFLDILKKVLKMANDDDLLSEVLLKTLQIYHKLEFEDTIESLSEKGLIRMVVDENGRLGYEINFED
jgi:hypothetical protein